MPGVLVLHSPHAARAPTIYRVTTPLGALAQHDPAWRVALQDVTALESAEGHQRLELLFAAHDLMVLPRLTLKGRRQDVGLALLCELIDRLHGMGKKVVYETDDDLSTQRLGGKTGHTMYTVAQRCDAVTVSTPHLRKQMQAQGCKQVYTLPNHLDMALWGRDVDKPRPYPTDNRHITIGLTGSATHYEDWRILASVLPAVLSDFPNTVFMLAGCYPDYFDTLFADPNLHNRCLKVKPRPYGVGGLDYVNLIHDCDVVLAPLLPDDGFNQSKSAIKALEGMAAARQGMGDKPSGAAVLATDMPVYRRVVNHNHNGLLVRHTPAAWYMALCRVCGDAQLRAKLGQAGLRWVRRFRDVDTTGWQAWRSAYQKILAA